MKLLDSRRLTGPNLLTRTPAALAEVAFDAGEDPALAVERWRAEVTRMHAALELAAPAFAVRHWPGGAALAFTGALDELLPLTGVNDFAVVSAAGLVAGGGPGPLEPRRSVISLELAQARNPPLRALEREAAARGVPFLADDAEVSLGMGRRSRTFALRSIPPLEAVPWDALGAIPIALITGTNGKTTCSRLLSRIVREAGLVAGTTSTDGVAIDERIVEEGDWTGPAAARLVLRSPAVEVAVLETARGGILRRGLAVEACDAALITNVAVDHLGDYGVHDLATMARAKAVIASVVRPGGRVVLNGDDASLLALAPGLTAEVVLFSTEPERPAIVAHRARGGEAFIVRDGWVVRARGAHEEPLARVDDIPITFGGAARYNVENALGVAALAVGLGLPREAIARGLGSFGASAGADAVGEAGADAVGEAGADAVGEAGAGGGARAVGGARPAFDNPGRGELYDVGGVRVLVDFGHNREAVRGVLALVDTLRERQGGGAGRLTVITGHAGDRSDEDFREVARAIHDHRPARVLVRDLPGYLRGRAPGVVPAIFREELLRLGMPGSAVEIAPTEAASLARALDRSSPGDFVALLVHLDSEEVAALLAERGARRIRPGAPTAR